MSDDQPGTPSPSSLLYDDSPCPGDRHADREGTPRDEKEAIQCLRQQLPLELLIRILHLVLKNSFYSSRCFKKLSVVCKDWHQIIVSTAELWTVIRDDTEPLAHIKKALCLSRNSPLSIQLTGHITLPVDLLIPHSNRWRSLDLKFTHSQEDPIASLLSATTPSLVDLSLSATRVPWSNFSLGEGRALRSLSVSGISIAWESPRLSGLTTLCLTNIPHPPTLSRLVDILQTSPNLRELILNTWRKREATSFYHLASTPTLAFPNLRRLSLRRIPPEFMTAILTYIQAPVCSRLSLNNLTDEGFALFRSCNSGFASLWTQVITAQDHLRISIYSSRLEFSAQGTDGKFVATFDRVDPSHSLSVIAPFISILNVRLSVEMWNSFFSDNWPVDVFDVLPPAVESLSIFSNYWHVLEHLARPKLGPAGVYEWPCPSLREVWCIIERPFAEKPLVNVEMVLKFLGGRWGKANLLEDVGPNAYNYPSKLDKLWFIGFEVTPGQMEALYEIEGGLIRFKDREQ
ncbi:hypothetical protein FRB99_001595 [Tulasnella sp. 403]|nr:hypothetical protein FRB99_001595 [Tulasnella sp. 403]